MNTNYFIKTKSQTVRPPRPRCQRDQVAGPAAIETCTLPPRLAAGGAMEEAGVSKSIPDRQGVHQRECRVNKHGVLLNAGAVEIPLPDALGAKAWIKLGWAQGKWRVGFQASLGAWEASGCDPSVVRDGGHDSRDDAILDGFARVEHFFTHMCRHLSKSDRGKARKVLKYLEMWRRTI